MVGSSALFSVQDLACEDTLEVLRVHSRTRQHTRALDVSWSAHHDDFIHQVGSVRFEEQRNIENHDRIPRMGGKEGLPVGGNERMHRCLDPIEKVAICSDRLAKAISLDLAIGDGSRSDCGNARDRRAPSGIKPVHGGIGIPNGNSTLSEEGGGRRLPHADRSGQAKPPRPSHAFAAARTSASTSGRTPNQRSNPGTA